MARTTSARTSTISGAETPTYSVGGMLARSSTPGPVIEMPTGSPENTIANATHTVAPGHEGQPDQGSAFGALAAFDPPPDVQRQHDRQHPGGDLRPLGGIPGQGDEYATDRNRRHSEEVDGVSPPQPGVRRHGTRGEQGARGDEGGRGHARPFRGLGEDRDCQGDPGQDEEGRRQSGESLDQERTTADQA